MKALTAFLLRHYADTIAIARLHNQLHAELTRRAEYAMRYQVHSPGQWVCRLTMPMLAVVLALVTMVIFCLR